jgi:hypothetical protein
MDTFHIKCRPVEMRVGDPIPTARLTLREMEQLSAKVRRRVEELYYEPEAAATPQRFRTK